MRTTVADASSVKEHMPKSLTIAISGGGTSGHVNPALAIAHGLQKLRPDIDIIFTGSKDGIESELVPRAGFEFIEVAAYPFENTPADIYKAVRDFWRGTQQCKKLIKKRQVSAIIGTGGYVAGPLLAAAKKLRIPRLIHEQNAFPGRSNRLMSRGADVVCVSYETSVPFFKKAKRVVLTGNPISDKFFNTSKKAARQELELSDDDFLILVTGGSLGARSINRSSIELAQAYAEYSKQHKGAQIPKVLLASGKTLYDEGLNMANNAGLMGYQGLKIENYLYNMVSYMAAADIVISRAGAIACAELAALGKAAILVPFPFAKGDHQRHNALAFVEKEAGICIDDENLSGACLFKAIEEIRGTSGKLASMEKAAATLASPTAAQDICTEFLTLVPSAK